MNFTNFKVSPLKWPFFYGWMILLVGALGVLMTAPGQTIGVSAFTDPLIDALQLSRDQLSLSYMGGTMISAFMLTKAGKLFDRFGAMKTALVASIGLGIALIYLSQTDKLAMLFGGSQVMTMVSVLLGFVLIRFFGQGVLTLASRTMVVKWFDAKRGLAVGVLSMVTAFGFSMAPKVFDTLIGKYGWSGAWLVIAILSGVIFPVVILLFFKNGPEAYGVLPDGFKKGDVRKVKAVRFPVHRDYNLTEARSTLSLWVFAGLTALYGLVITGLTFHIVSIFAERGLDKDIAISVFQPLAFVAVVTTLICSPLSDYIKMKYLAFAFCISGMVGMYSIAQLGSSDIYYNLLIFSFGICSGIHPLVITLFLPRFFGKLHLGAITGQAMTLVVFASALGPILFSQSLSITGSYTLAAYICGVAFFIILILGLVTKNPQLEHAQV